MKQWIRWSGLIGFVVTLGGLAAFLLFAAGPIIKGSIEHFGSQAAGAKVSVDDVSVSLSPLGVTLDNLQVADADKPMENLVQFDQAVAQLELAPLLLGKGIVKDLSVNNLQFNTARSESGKLEKTDEVKEADNDSKDSDAKGDSGDKESSPSVASVPSVDEILAREPLKTEQAGKEVQQAFDDSKQAIDQATAAVPDSKALVRYEDELKALLSTDIKSLDDFKQRKKQLDALKKQFKQDKEAVAQAKAVISNSRRELADKLSELKKAPGQDVATIKNKYQLDAQGAANLSALLFGDQAGEWANKALYWYEKVKPYLASDEKEAEDATAAAAEQRAAGQFIHFPSDDPWPEFLIRKATMSAPMLGGSLEINALDITHQQDVLGRPAHITLQGQQLTDIEDLNIDVVLDHRQGVNRDNVTLTVKDWTVRDINLGIAGSKLDSALFQVQGLAVVSSGTLQAKADAQASQAQFGGKGKTTFAKETNLALAKINQFDINAKASGKITAPDVELGSDLDKRLNQAFKQRLKDKQNELEAKLEKRLQEKMQSYLGDYADDLQQLNSLDSSLDDKTAELQQMADSKLEDFEAQQRAKAQAKAKAEEEKAKRKLEAEKRKAEEKAKQKQKELERKAKEKLKNLF